MNAASHHDTRVGWCPSIATPMAASDGLLVRVKPTAATVSATAARALAEAAQRFGNGGVDLTNRANMQFRGLRSDTTDGFAEAVRANGLASNDPKLEEIRNVTADPLGPDDPEAAFDSHALARILEAMLAGEPCMKTLPPKFGFLVDCGRLIPMPDARGDIVVRERGGGLVIGLDGGELRIPCNANTLPGLACQLARAFLDLAGPPDTPPYRMRDLVAAIGEDAILAAAGHPDLRSSEKVRSAEPGRDAAASPGPTEPPCLRQRHLALMYAPAPADSPIGYLQFVSGNDGAFIVGIPGGRLEATVLADLAGLAESFADGTLRMTPWRALVLAGVAASGIDKLRAELDRLALITDPADPRRHLRGPAPLSPNADATSAKKALVP